VNPDDLIKNDPLRKRRLKETWGHIPALETVSQEKKSFFPGMGKVFSLTALFIGMSMF
jgi:hypothetical protein